MENWVIKNKKADFKFFMQELGISEVMARCLVNRGMDSVESMKAFLYSGPERMYDPLLMKDIRKACDILHEKILQRKKIRIIGDYDVDGVTASYILYRSLKMVGAEVDYEIPDRIRDGYGINIRMVDAAHEAGIDTIVTCDNGITAMEQIEQAKQYNMTVIVTDHHNLLITQDGSVEIPKADAVINPKQPDCGYPFKGLCGAAVAYKLCSVLMKDYSLPKTEDYLTELLSYTAIATICDVMDLVDENRIIVKYGLELLKNTNNLGLLALMEAGGINKQELNTFHLGFAIGPCLNASGRLDTAKKGLELLLAQTKDEAARLAEEVRELNNLRKDMTADNVDKAICLIEETDLKEDKVLVVYLKDCHESIAGIIAGKIRERYHKPTIVLTDAQDCIKGSGRSIEQYNMIEELQKCRNLFLKLGGHPMAAGLSMLPENVEALRLTLNRNTTLTKEMLVPKVVIDILLPLGYITEELVQELHLLEPFGKGNEKPLFAERNLKIKSAIMIGKKASGLRLRVENQYGREMEAVYFGNVEEFFAYIGEAYGTQEAERLKTGRGSDIMLSVTYYPRINEYNGFRSLQIMIQNYRKV